MRPRPLLYPFLLMISSSVLAHGGIPPLDTAGYPDPITSPPSPNRSPVCTPDSDNEPCGLQNSCLANEASQPLLDGENRYQPGETFHLPWLITIVHGVGPLQVRLRHAASGREESLVSNYPQGNNGAGDIMVVAPLEIPSDFPTGAAVLEVRHDTDNGPYMDCVDLNVQSSEILVFIDGFEN